MPADKVKNFNLRTKRLRLIRQNASFELFSHVFVLLNVQNYSVSILSLLFDSLFAHTDSARDAPSFKAQADQINIVLICTKSTPPPPPPNGL